MLPLQGEGRAGKGKWVVFSTAVVNPMQHSSVLLRASLPVHPPLHPCPGGGALKGYTCTSGLAIGMAQLQLKLWSGLVLTQGLAGLQGIDASHRRAKEALLQTFRPTKCQYRRALWRLWYEPTDIAKCSWQNGRIPVQP